MMGKKQNLVNMTFWAGYISCLLLSCQMNSSKIVGKWQGVKLMTEEDTLQFSDSIRTPTLTFTDTSFKLKNRFGAIQNGTYEIKRNIIHFYPTDQDSVVINALSWQNDNTLMISMNNNGKPQSLILTKTVN